MKVKGNKRSKIVLLMGFTGATLLASGFLATYATAQVTGSCVNCHTMHNSQDGTTQVHIGAGAGWSAGSLGGGDTFGASDQLLKTDCVGCHSATGSTTTIVTANGNKVPIVFNMGGYPAAPLAGGNFFSVSLDQKYGHNVGGISGADTLLTTPPGSQATCLDGISCHTSLSLTDAQVAASGAQFNYGGAYKSASGKFNGCKGCHNKVAHHNPNDTSYRFLGGHGDVGIDLVEGRVGGLMAGATYEDPNWEQTPSNTVHNIYKKQADVDVLDSMGSFCAGCHQNFHAVGKDTMFMANQNGGDDNTDGLISANSGTNPWLRHPTNVNIPVGDPLGEYAAMNTNYDPKVPVAQDPTANTNIINAGDQVMCLSCHRAHASQYEDALRFNYSKMNAHSAPVADQGTGCFFCHTNKDT